MSNEKDINNLEDSSLDEISGGNLKGKIKLENLMLKYGVIPPVYSMYAVKPSNPKLPMVKINPGVEDKLMKKIKEQEEIIKKLQSELDELKKKSDS